MSAPSAPQAKRHLQKTLRAKLTSRDNPNGHQAIAQSLSSQGVTHVYSLPGSPLYWTLGACVQEGLQVVGCRSQFGALGAAMAHNYREGAMVAVAICSPGPGLTNAVTGLSHALQNKWPLVVIGGVVEQPPDQAGYFQAFDGAGAVAPVCKAVIQIRDRDQLGDEISQAVAVACTRPEGPVFVEVTTGVLNARGLTAQLPRRAYETAQAVCVQTKLDQASKPVLILGEDVRWGSAVPENLRHLLEAHSLPVLATPMGRGLLSDDHPLSVYAAKDEALRHCDFVLICGADLDWRFSNGIGVAQGVSVERLAPDLAALTSVLGQSPTSPDRKAWCKHLDRAHKVALETLVSGAHGSEDEQSMMQLCKVLATHVPEDAVTILDSGLALTWGHLLWPVHQPFRRMTLGHLGIIGLGIPYAIGEALQNPAQTVVALVGDVGFGLGSVELETATRNGANLIVIVADNGGINGQLAQRRYMPEDANPILQYDQNVDYAEIAKGWGAHGMTVCTKKALKDALQDAFAMEGPVVISVPMDLVFALNPETSRELYDKDE